MELVLHVATPTVSLAIMAFAPIVLIIIIQVALNVLPAQMATMQVLVILPAPFVLPV